MPAAGAAPPVPRRTGLSVRRRLLAMLLALFALGLGALCTMVRGYAYQTASITYDQLLTASVLSITDSLQYGQHGWQLDMPYAALALLEQAPRDRVFYRVSARDSSLVTGYADLPAPPRAPTSEAARTPQLFDAVYQGQPVRFAWMERHVAGPEGAAVARVQVGQTREAHDALARRILWHGTLALVAFAAAALGLAYWGLHRSLAPIRRIEDELSARTVSDLHPIAAPVPEELGNLVHALDGFMARLEENLDTLHLFIAETAHQLRTPLAALRAQLQLALEEDDSDEQRHSLQAVLRNAERLSRLVNQLLSDASVLHRSNAHDFARIDLAEILPQALHDSVPQAEPRPDVRLYLPQNGAGAGQAWVLGDSLMLREALKNLLDNALRHGAAARGRLDVRLARAGSDWQVTISDQGPGLPPQLGDSVFERFVRGPGPRTAGAGLGLSIAKRVADSHQGRLTLRNRPQGGLDAILTLPALPS